MKYEETAKRLRLALDNAGMKSQELADRSGVSKSSISQYVNGSHCPGNISSEKMAKVLHVNALWLMGYDVAMDREFTVEKAKEDLEILEKFSLLNERNKKIIIAMIDSMLNEKESGV